MEDIKNINIEQKNYPILLKQIKNPPKTLYYRGNLLLNKPCIAIVGTRRFSLYGKQVALELGRALSNIGFIIVSGLATGIDTFAHQAALWEKEKTIAVLGTGIDDKSIYPRQNIKLAHQIIENKGAIISEFPPGTRATKFNFPKRNRIISGLSLGVLVIEAKEKSGALITAQWARKQKRVIWAVPGSIYSANSRGTNNLISQGAVLVRNASDIIRTLKLKNIEIKNSDKIIKGNNKEENLIISCLRDNALHIESIIQKTGLPAQSVISRLSDLEIQNKIINLGGNVYALNK